MLQGLPALAQEAAPAEDHKSQLSSSSQVKSTETGPITFRLGGQLRLRYENDDGFTVKGYDPGGDDQLLLERVRLDLSTRFRGRALLFLQLQDAHPFLTRFKDEAFPTSNPLEDTLDIRQLHLEWLHIGGSPLGFRIGRQQIAYGDQRVFGPGSWGNTGRYAWDAAMLKVDTPRVAADMWVGNYLQYKSGKWPDRSVPHFLTFVTYAQIKKLPLRLDFFYVLKNDSSGTANGESGRGDVLTHSVGTQAEGQWRRGLLDGGTTFVVQRGRYGGDAVRAFGANLKLGTTLPVAWSPRLGSQFTWGSGDADPRDGVHGTFDGVFGGRDIYFYGYLNLFFWANLRDYQGEFSVRPHRTVTGYVEYHHFALDEPRDAWYTTGLQAYRRDLSGQSGRSLGEEIDLRAVWTLRNHLELMGGYGRFFPGTFVTKTGPSRAANWLFVQAAYSW